ncbi:MAG: hypothetical protein ACPGGK_15060 [Pikeienuella sp.]
MPDFVKSIAKDIIDGRGFRALADSSAPVADGYEVQFAMAPRVAEAKGGVGGRKIAWNLPALMEKFGLDEPGAGHVFADEICKGNANLKLNDYHNFMMEPEFAAILAVDLAPRAGGWDRESAAQAVSHFTVAFELLDRRGGSADHPASVIANNVFNAGLCYDTDAAISPADLNPDNRRTIVTHDEEVILDQVGARPQHPLDAVAFLANHFNAHGITPRAGEILLCGAHMPLYPMEHPGKLTMKVEGVGEISFRMR